jgi:prevent-host-death family protein
MPITMLSSREYNHNRSLAEKAAEKGPVFITKRGKTTLVILSAEEYDKLARKQPSIGDLIGNAEAAEIDFDPPRINFTPRPVDFD